MYRCLDLKYALLEALGQLTSGAIQLFNELTIQPSIPYRLLNYGLRRWNLAY